MEFRVFNLQNVYPQPTHISPYSFWGFTFRLTIRAGANDDVKFE